MTVAELEEAWAKYRRQTFGGGITPFDDVMFGDNPQGLTPAALWAHGVDAVMAEFIKHLRQHNTEERGQ